MSEAIARTAPVRSQPALGSLVQFALLVFVLVAQGWAIAHSAMLVLPLICLLVFVLAPTLPLVPVLGSLLTLRVLVDAIPDDGSRYSTAVDLPGFLAAALIALALGLLWRRRVGLRPTLAVAGVICFWTLVMVAGEGGSAVSLREGVREASLLAVAVIVVNSRGVLSLDACTRIVQVAGAVAGIVALVQVATHTGMDVAGDIRSNGTFSHPNAAAVYFAVAALASLWRWLELGRGRLDAAFLGLFSLAAVATFSIGGVGALLAALVVFALLRSGSARFRLALCLGVAGLALVFALTPIGGNRIASETSTSFSGPSGAETNSLEWRVHKWRHLVEEWKDSPAVGHGLGWTVAQDDGHSTNSQLPHNEYVRYLAETGALGVALLLAGLAALGWGLLRARNRGGRAAGALGGALLAGLMVNAVAANTLLYTPAAYAAVAVLAAASVELGALRRGGAAGRRDATA
jgi:O-antigen ligase